MKVSIVAAVLLLVGAAERVAQGAESAPIDADVEEEALGPRGNLRTSAKEVRFDTRQKRLELSGDVRVDVPPFHLRSDRIVLTRTKLGLEIDGEGKLAFCPCLGTPLMIDFTSALVAPPGDIVLTDPKLRVYGIPILYLPYFWLRSDEKIGVLPPDLAYRGQDGFFFGEGVHLPFKTHAGDNALDFRAGAYLFDGFVADARLRTPVSFGRVRYERLAHSPAPSVGAQSANTDDGLLVDARGASHGVAWDVDAIRGRRGVASTTELDAAAKPWDRAAVEGALRFGSFVAETRVRAVSRRGGGTSDFDAVGPMSAIRVSNVFGGVVYDATLEGGSLRIPGESLTVARAEVGVLGAVNVGLVSASL